jgi:cytochrome d ubiquinol oxidase subunit II
MLVFGAAMGNMLQGVPLHFSWNLTSHHTGSFITLVNPFTILCGLLSVTLAMHMGAAMIMNRSEGAIYERARKVATWSGLAAFGLFTAAGIWVSFLHGYHLQRTCSRPLIVALAQV